MLEAVDALEAAFARHDLGAVLDLFASDADVGFIGSARSEQAVGRAALERDLARLLALPEVADGTLTIAWSRRRVRVERDVAWVLCLGRATWATSRRHSVFDYRLTGVLVRRHGRWLWHTHHGSAPGALS